MMASPSPFMTSEQSRRRREAARARRRSRRRVVVIAVLAVAIVGALVVMAVARSHTTAGSLSVASRATQPHRASPTAVAAPSVSQTGLPLGTPPLALRGVGTPDADPVRIAFHTPPHAGLLFNLDTGQVLWQHEPHEHLHIASLTKMMTALLAVRSDSPDTPVLVTKQAVKSAGSKVGVLPLGRHIPMSTMLYGLMLPSGNDAAIALAQQISGSSSRFVARMNAEAAKLGMACTRYASPSGYVDPGNYSCAADLAVLAHVDLQQPLIAKVARTYKAVLPFPIKGGRIYLYNNNPLLTYHYPGITGLKTGFTLAAGKCLVATAERDGVRLAAVVLNSPDPGTQARQLLDRGFEDVYHQRYVPSPTVPTGL